MIHPSTAAAAVDPAGRQASAAHPVRAELVEACPERSRRADREPRALRQAQGERSRFANASLKGSTRRALWFALVLHAALALAIALVTNFDGWYVLKAMVAMAAAAGLIAATVQHHAPHTRFGPANRVTLLRLSLVLLLAAAIGEPWGAQGWQLWGVIGLAMLAALLDAVDGLVARASGLASAFGARFDMETDALLTLVLCALVLQANRAGAWVLAAGLMRYAFVAATWRWPWLAQPLPASRRRQTVCVLQITSLIVCLVPVLPHGLSITIAAVSLALLSASFAADIALLSRRRAADRRGLPDARPHQEQAP